MTSSEGKNPEIVKWGFRSKVTSPKNHPTLYPKNRAQVINNLMNLQLTFYAPAKGLQGNYRTPGKRLQQNDRILELYSSMYHSRIIGPTAFYLQV